MMRPLECILALLFSGALNTTLAQPGSVQSLPLGSREAVVAQLEKEIYIPYLLLSTKTRPAFQGGGNYYDPSKGPLEPFIKEMLPLLLNTKEITRNDVGTAGFKLGLCTFINESDSLILGEFETNFPVIFDGDTLVLPEPEHFVKYPYGADWLPVSGVLHGVEAVSYDIRKPNGDWMYSNVTPNGVYYGCWLSEVRSNNVLYLEMRYVDPDVVHGQNLSGKIRFWYNVQNLLYEDFDVRTGAKIASVMIHQKIIVTNGVPCVTLIGPTNTQVRIESTTNLHTWSDTQTTVQLDSSGKGSFSLDLTQPQLFFRGRLLTE